MLDHRLPGGAGLVDTRRKRSLRWIAPLAVAPLAVAEGFVPHRHLDIARPQIEVTVNQAFEVDSSSFS